MSTKQCKLCHKDLPLDAFNKHPRCTQGRENACKTCRSVQRIEKARNLGAKPKVRNAHLIKYDKLGRPQWKTCQNCDRELPIYDFKTVGRSKCRECENESHLRRRYKSSYKEKREIYINQDGLCAICVRSFPYDKLCFDHSHQTGKVRGLLCRHCNTNLGILGDGENLENALAPFCYLAAHETRDKVRNLLENLLTSYS